MKPTNHKDKVTCEIVEQIAVLSTNANTGWRTELNIVSWNGRAPKLEIRDWAPDYSKMSKGVTLTTAEARALKEALIKVA